MTGDAEAPEAGRGIGVAAALVGALTLAALIVMLIWIAVMMAGGAGGFAIMAVMPIMGPIVLVLGILGVILSIVAIVKGAARRLWISGLVLSATPLVAWVIVLIAALVIG